MTKEKKTKKIEVRITEEMLSVLNQFANKNETSIGSIVRIALKEYLKNYENREL